jgi:hypothetical protein
VNYRITWRHIPEDNNIILIFLDPANGNANLKSNGVKASPWLGPFYTVDHIKLYIMVYRSNAMKCVRHLILLFLLSLCEYSTQVSTTEGNRGSSVSIVTRLWIRWPRNRDSIIEGSKILFFFSTASRQILEPNKPLICCLACISASTNYATVCPIHSYILHLNVPILQFPVSYGGSKETGWLSRYSDGLHGPGSIQSKGILWSFDWFWMGTSQRAQPIKVGRGEEKERDGIRVVRGNN